MRRKSKRRDHVVANGLVHYKGENQLTTGQVVDDRYLEIL